MCQTSARTKTFFFIQMVFYVFKLNNTQNVFFFLSKLNGNADHNYSDKNITDNRNVQHDKRFEMEQTVTIVTTKEMV